MSQTFFKNKGITNVLEIKCGQLKLNYCSASAELVNDDAKGWEYLNNVLRITKY